MLKHTACSDFYCSICFTTHQTIIRANVSSLTEAFLLVSVFLSFSLLIRRSFRGLVLTILYLSVAMKHDASPRRPAFHGGIWGVLWSVRLSPLYGHTVWRLSSERCGPISLCMCKSVEKNSLWFSLLVCFLRELGDLAPCEDCFYSCAPSFDFALWFFCILPSPLHILSLIACMLRRWTCDHLCSLKSTR